MAIIDANAAILLKADHLSRHFGALNAVDDVSFHVRKGEVLGFLGPNGAGKSTTMKMLTGNLAADNGSVVINGHDLLNAPSLAKQSIGYLPESPPLYRELTVREFLRFSARLHGISSKDTADAVNTAMQRCGLLSVDNRLIGQLSKGYQQRTGIAQAIMHQPAVVILDEPTAGLDPLQIQEIRLLIREIASQHSVILSTHILPEVEMLCDRVQIMHQGKLIFSDSLSAMKNQRQKAGLRVAFNNQLTTHQLQQLPGVVSVDAIAGEFLLHYQPEHSPIDALVQTAVAENWGLRLLKPETDTLEQLFNQLVNNDLQEPIH